MVRVGGPGDRSVSALTASMAIGAPAASTTKAAAITVQARPRLGGKSRRAAAPPIQAATSQAGAKLFRTSGQAQAAPTRPHSSARGHAGDQDRAGDPDGPAQHRHAVAA